MAIPNSTIPLLPLAKGIVEHSRIDSLYLSIVTGSSSPTAGEFTGCVTVGRGETAGLRLADPTVSQFHADFSPVAGGVQVRDLGSTNGTFIGAVRIKDAIVPVDSIIAVGSTLIRVGVATRVVPQPQTPTSFGALVGQDEPMRELYSLLGRLAPTEISVLLLGETGTGKEEIARSLHMNSPRRARPFQVLDCTAIPRDLAQSYLFGHERGAFTGATSRRAGCFEAADGGTLFIDEIGELPLEVQPMLLRAVQQREITPVGSTRSERVNVRLICATLKDLRTMVNKGQFREDLYYRLAQATVHVPALREHKNDVPILIHHFLHSIRADVKAARRVSREVLAALQQRDYRGNVRELRNTVERLALLATGPEITSEDLKLEMVLTGLRAHCQKVFPSSSEFGNDSHSDEILKYKDARQTAVFGFEARYLARLMEIAGDNLSRAAQIADLERHNLRELLRRHSLYVSPKNS